MAIEIPIEILQRAWIRELQRAALAAIRSSADDNRNRMLYICNTAINNRVKRKIRRRMILRHIRY